MYCFTITHCQIRISVTSCYICSLEEDITIINSRFTRTNFLSIIFHQSNNKPCNLLTGILYTTQLTFPGSKVTWQQHVLQLQRSTMLHIGLFCDSKVTSNIAVNWYIFAMDYSCFYLFLVIFWSPLGRQIKK